MSYSKILVIGLLSFSASVWAAKPNASAPQGGTLNYDLGSEPQSLHPVMSGDVYGTAVNGYIQDSMCNYDIETYEFAPHLAESWEVSKDGLTFTFKLRKDLFFHNGTPVTTEDVKFSLETIREPKHQALNLMPYYETFKKIEIIDPQTIKFTASEKYFKNLESLCSLPVIPKSVYGDIAKSVKMQKESIGAGPYVLEKYDKGQSILLKKFDKWYGKNVPYYKGYNNFEQIRFRFTKEDSILVEKLKKGDVDYAALSSDAFLKAKGGNFGKTVFAKKVVNNMPKSYGYIGFNFKNEILKNLNIRHAIAMLVNRAEMNKKFKDGMAELATGPVSVKSAQAADMKPILFDPKKAQELLKKEGFTDSDKNGILDRTVDGKKQEMKFTLIYANKDSEKYWTMFKEDAKKAGVEITLKFMEWNSFIKTVDDRTMDLWAMGWGAGSVESDPKQIWHSSSASKGGSNYGTYSNSEVDKLIDEARQELDSAKRAKLLKKVNTLIAEDIPYVFLFNNKFEFYANSNKVKMPADTFKYDFGVNTWWSASAK